MVHFIVSFLLATVTQSADPDEVNPVVDDIFTHAFECDPTSEVFETEFTFLSGLAHGFVHAERQRIFFEYYFPAEHWIAFSTADRLIEGEAEDQCSSCYYSHSYPMEANTHNRSNLFPSCIEECLEDTIFVATINCDEENIHNWNIFEFQIIAQQSVTLQKKMYRMPPISRILEVWGSPTNPYRQDANYETSLYKIGTGEAEKEFIHAKFWREYNFAPNNDLDEYDGWQAFVSTNDDLYYPDSLCFTSIGSFHGGEYPYDDDVRVKGHSLPGFYIDTEHLVNIHCFKLDDIKVDCGQDWSWMTMTKQQFTEHVQQEEDDMDTDTEGDTDTDTSDEDIDIQIFDENTEISYRRHWR